METLWEKEEHKEIKYEPKSVREILTEMKDISELILDLAYSAVIFDSEDIASEVRYLEARMDTLNYQIRLTALVAARTIRDAEQLSGILQVASAAERISNAAGDIVNLKIKYGSQPFLKEVLKYTEESVFKYELKVDSKLENMSLKDLNVEKNTGVRVIAVRRGKKWFYGPGGEFKLKGGDSIILRGDDEGFQSFKELVGRYDQ
ncbi:MAG TPA: potassium transporter TrkA [Thermoplasmata archaeon]|nr:potassium transporter TrkA [Thermoplasmata archaeon]